MNPLRGAKATALPPVIGCVITHLPFFSGYHRDRMDVVKTCLITMRERAEIPLPIYVWDNDSHPHFREWLLDEYKPEYLTLSPNIGKASARSSIARTFPPSTVLCISDDDVYYYPGWLKPQMELLQGFPNVGVVSACPVRTQFRWGIKSTLAWAEKNAILKSGRFISEEYDRDFCISIGRDYKFHLQSSKKDLDYLIEYNGLKAYATAHHFQFIALAGRIEYIVQWDGEAISDERKFDRAIDEEGYLRLTTVERYTRHIGNVMEPIFYDALRIEQEV